VVPGAYLEPFAVLVRLAVVDHVGNVGQAARDVATGALAMPQGRPELNYPGSPRDEQERVMAATARPVSRADQRLAELGAIEQRYQCPWRAFQAVEDRHLGMQSPVLDQREYLLLEGGPAVQMIEYQEAL
jgi:hypothetical protein